MRKIVVIRTSESKEAIYGTLIVIDGQDVLYHCKTIENKAKSFPAGRYPIRLEYSPRFRRDLWELYGIAGRSEIKIHVANYWNQLEGCIGVGRRHQDINHDGVIDLAQSTTALNEFHAAMGEARESEIIVA